jgi:hypothetical protein
MRGREIAKKIKLENFEREQLRAELQAAREEIERLNSVIDNNIDDGIDKIMAMSDEQISALAGYEGRNPEDQAKIARQCMDIALLKTQLAAHQLVIQQMREVLVEMSKDCVTNWPALKEAVTLQPTTEALDAYVQKAVEQEREACARVCEYESKWEDTDTESAITCAEAIRGRK